MSPARSILLPAAILLLAALAAWPASACIWNAPVCVGEKWEDCHQTEAEKRAEERKWSAEDTRARLLLARQRVRTGKVDEAAELAELLIPNIRPIATRFSDCGPEGEIDYGEGRETEESRFRSLVAGSALANADIEDFGFILRNEANFPFGPRCNAEFRSGFAEALRGSLTPTELRQAWLFLTARQREADIWGSAYHRLVRFEGRSRAPPVQWKLHDEWLEGQVKVAIRRTGWGRSLAGAADVFWATHAGRLASDAQVCPAANAEWSRVRESLIAKMAERQAMLDERRGIRR